MQKHPSAIGIIVGIVGMLLVAVSVWMIVVYTRAYNVAASEQHADAVRWTLETAGGAAAE